MGVISTATITQSTLQGWFFSLLTKTPRVALPRVCALRGNDLHRIFRLVKLTTWKEKGLHSLPSIRGGEYNLGIEKKVMAFYAGVV